MHSLCLTSDWFKGGETRISLGKNSLTLRCLEFEFIASREGAFCIYETLRVLGGVVITVCRVFSNLLEVLQRRI